MNTVLDNDEYYNRRVKVINSNKKRYRIDGVVGLCGEIVETHGNEVAVRINGIQNSLSRYGWYWFKLRELKVLDESEDNNMTGFNNVAIVNLVDDYSKKDYGFAVYDKDIDLIIKSEFPVYVVVNPRSKDNKVLGILKEIKTVEDYGKSVTAQVVGVVNMEAYNARVEEENRQKELAKKKANIEKELKAEIEKLNNIALYEKMASEHPENVRLTELVNELKELGE